MAWSRLVPPNPKINPRNETNLARDTANREPGAAASVVLRIQTTIRIEVGEVSAAAGSYNARPEEALIAHLGRGTAEEVAAIREILASQCLSVKA